MRTDQIASIDWTRDYPQIDLVSFDVFDTLVARIVETPIDVFRIVRASLLSTQAALLDPTTIDAFPDLRVKAEFLSRVEKEQRCGSSEVNFDEIYASLAHLTHADRSTLEALKQAELEAEKRLIYQNKVAVRLLDGVRQSGRKVVLCSDMYLPSQFIRELLRTCGYTDADPLFVSCEHGKSKHQGTLFKHISLALGISPERILHIGDNPQADVLMANRAGCCSLHLPAPQMNTAEASPWVHIDQNARTASSIINGLLLKRRRASRERQSDASYELGFRVFGPLFAGFLLWLGRSLAHKRPDKVLLLARDTHWLTKYLPRRLACEGCVPEIHYVHASRAALMLPSMTDFPVHRLKHLLASRAARPVGMHLHRLGLNPDALMTAIRSSGFHSADEPALSTDARMISLLGKVQHSLLRVSVQRRRDAQDYLDGFVAGAKHVAVVDVGWSANIQASLIRLLWSRHPDLKIGGYYVALFASAKENMFPGHPMHSWMTGANSRSAAEQTMWSSGGVELLEFAMRAPGGSTLGYQRHRDGSVTPVLEDAEPEDAQDVLARHLQAGVSAFMEEFLERFADLNADGLDARAWAVPFHRLVTAPTFEEAELLGDILHCDAVIPDVLRVPFAPVVADTAAQPVAAAGGCFWPPGFIARNGLTRDDTFNEALYFALNHDVRATYAEGSGHLHWHLHGQEEGRIASWAAWTRHHRRSSGT